MSNGEEEAARRKKIILDGGLAALAIENQLAVLDGKLSDDQISEMIALDEEWLEKTRACMKKKG